MQRAKAAAAAVAAAVAAAIDANGNNNKVGQYCGLGFKVIWVFQTISEFFNAKSFQEWP